MGREAIVEFLRRKWRSALQRRNRAERATVDI